MNRKLKHALGFLAILGAGAGGYAFRANHASRGPILAHGPILECPEKINFGVRDYGEVATMPVTISNPGDQPLHLKDVRSDCSCSGLEQEEEGRTVQVSQLTIPPQGTVNLTTRLMVRGRPCEPEMHTIRFQTDDPQRPEASITLSVPLVKGIAFVPTCLICGDILIGTKSEHFLTVRHTGDLPFHLTRVQSSDPELIMAELMPMAGPRAGDKATVNSTGFDGRVRVVVSAKKVGPINGTLTVHFRRGDVQMNACVPVGARGVELVNAYPSLVVLPRRSTSGWVYDTTVLCRSHSRKPFTLSVKDVPSDLAVEVVGGKRSSSTRIIRIEWKHHEEVPARTSASESRLVRLIATETGRSVPIESTVKCVTEEELK